MVVLVVMVVLGLCQPHYQNLLIIYLKVIVKNAEIKTVNLNVTDFKELKDNKPFYNCKECRKEQLKLINGLIKIFPNTYKFCNNNINKFILLLKKGVLLEWSEYKYTSTVLHQMNLHFKISI